MAPALIEAAATVSQGFGGKLKFINTKILDNISNFANSRDESKAIVSSCTLTTNPGRNTIKVSDKSLTNQASDKEELLSTNTSSSETMDRDINCSSESSSLSSMKHEEKLIAEQSSEQGQGCTATCAPFEADGAKVDSAKADLVDKNFEIEMREKSINTMEKLKSLDCRAKSLIERLRSLQADRLITHVQKQAKWLDDSPGNPYDPRWRDDKQLHNSAFIAGADISAKIAKRPLNGTFDMNNSPQSGQLVNILEGNDSSPSTCPSSQSTSLGTNLTTVKPSKGTQSSNLSIGNSKELKKHCSSFARKKDVFGVLATHVKPLSNLNDPDATDSESEDDGVETINETIDKFHPQSSRKRIDRSWAKDRVKIGSMCTWVQAQIADLSHKIKRYGDLYHHAKLSRQHVVLEEPRQKVVNSLSEQKCQIDGNFNKNSTNNDDLQDNIFAKLEVHKNGLAKGLSIQQKSEIMYEKGTGARTIPVVKFPKHKYVKQTVQNEVKNGCVSYRCPGLPAPFPCEQCQKACTTGLGKTTGNLSAALLDHSYHGQLSPDYDLQLPYALESVLRKEKLCTGRKSLLLASLSTDPYAEKRNSAVPNLPYTPAAITNSVKARLDRKRQRRASKQTGNDSEQEDHPKPKKKAISLSAASQLQKRANNLRAPSGTGSGESRPSTPITEQSFLSASYPSPSLSQLVKKKNRPSSEYDINNIVIPYSISSSTRLEKPQYKEILTPGWRLLQMESELNERHRELQEEDTSDDAYAERHSHCEVAEHKRFTSYFQLPLKRSRSTRKSSECNTPEAYSPSHMENSNSSIGSTTTPTEFVVATPLSGKLARHNSMLSLSAQPEDQRVACWPKRTFPLANEDLLQLDQDVDNVRPSVEENRPSEIHGSVTCNPSDKDASVSCSVDNEQASCLPPCNDDDEDDDRWTVKLVSDEEPAVRDAGTARKGIVLKLAKK